MNHWPLEEGIKATAVFLESYEAFFSSHSDVPVFVVKYEVMVADYTRVVSDVLAWLGLDVAPEVEQFIVKNARRDAHTAMTEDVPVRDFRNSVQRWRKVLTQAQENLAMEMFGHFLKRYGYL